MRLNSRRHRATSRVTISPAVKDECEIFTDDGGVDGDDVEGDNDDDGTASTIASAERKLGRGT